MRSIKIGKKGVELSLNVIIIAILCIIVLVVLVLIFRDQIGQMAGAFGGIIKNTTGSSKDATSKFTDLFSTGDSSDSNTQASDKKT